MGNQNHRNTLLVQFTEEIHDLCVVLQILSGSGFIQQQHFRTEDQNGGNGHPFFLTVTQG